jgi:hypothetical protein
VSDELTARAVALREELMRALPRDLILMLADYIATSELSVSAMLGHDPVRLRHAVAALALETLGVTPQLIETFRTSHTGQRLADETDLRRH